MTIWKEFQGKTIDDAIREACDYFGVERERLEIEIVNDATSGIFGLMGGKKAGIRASRVSLSDLLGVEAETVLSIPDEKIPSEAAPPSRREAGGAPSPGSRIEGRHHRGGQNLPDRPDGRGKNGRISRSGPEGQASDAPQRREEEARPPTERPGRSSRRREEDGLPSDPVFAGKYPADGDEAAREDLPEFDLRACDQAALLDLVTDTVTRLVRPIVGEMTSSATLAGNRVRVGIECGASSGLLLGREGQTLAALQYIAGRIIAKKLGSSIRLQFDAGNYRERQDERLRELALSLAEKVKSSRRSHSTRPLSAYQRRIIHLAREDDPLVQTFSKGEGGQRRVIIQLKRGDQAVDGFRNPEDAFAADFEIDFGADLNGADVPGADQPLGETLDEVLDAVLDGVLEDPRNSGEK
jgi:spoIIIJ-associated protein